ncbi:MAG: molybdopterin-guanine dinucleotide biosynthesis protein B [Gemmatimonadetes bacterium]|nr:molybdopterin-guanine dinucleotide biosynthesis protein B [Gemmatimonadota bacterium]
MSETRLGDGSPVIVCILGKKKSGKTATTIGLVRELLARGRIVMTAKHGHRFDMDREGTDSWRHRVEAGAHRVVIASPGQCAVMGEWEDGGEQPLEELVRRFLSDAEVVVAEGFKTSSAPKIEVFRRATHAQPLYRVDPEVNGEYIAVLTDVPGFQAHVPVLHVDDPDRFSRLADLVENLVDGERA